MKQNISLFLICFVIALGLVVRCTNTTPTEPPAQTEQWYCSTIADLQTDPNDTTGIDMRAVAYKDKFWPVGYKFKVGFLGTKTTQQTNLVKSVCAEWAKVANVYFEFPAAGPYDLRISFVSGDGAWSYVGIDSKNKPQSEATMNLGWYAADAYRHEIGHHLGLLHEHSNPISPIKWNEAQVIKDLSGPPNNWTDAMIRYNVLNPYPLPNVITTALDKVSIMMYPIPASWTLDGFTTPGGQVLSDVDKKFIGERYPFTQPPTTGNVTLRKGQVDTIILQIDELKKKIDESTQKMKELNDATKKALGRSLGFVPKAPGGGELSESWGIDDLIPKYGILDEFGGGGNNAPKDHNWTYPEILRGVSSGDSIVPGSRITLRANGDSSFIMGTISSDKFGGQYLTIDSTRRQ